MPSTIRESLKEFEQQIIWKSIQGANGRVEVPEPQTGIDSTFDAANDRCNNIKAELNSYLEKIKKQFQEYRRITFSHAKNRYEIEIPEEYVKGNLKPEEFELQSARQGY